MFSEPQMNPLHYPFLMIWYRIAGDDPADFRLFGVIVFLLTLPFLFLLAKSLFKSNLAGWITISLYSVSPHIHLFTQEARYYILWSFILIVSHYFFLKSIQLDNFKWWLAYSLSVMFSLYVSPVSGLIILGHMIYILLTRKDVIRTYITAISAGLILYLPWAVSLLLDSKRITAALAWHTNTQIEVTFWLPLLGQLFYLFSIFSSTLDIFTVFDRTSTEMPPETGGAFLIGFAVLVVIITAVISLIKKEEKEIKYFLLLIIFPGLIAFYIHDIARHTMTSWWWRYLIFISTGVILLITGYFYKRIEKGKLFYFVIFIAFTAIGINSLFNISQSRHWLIGKKLDLYIHDAQLFSQLSKPLIITDYGSSGGFADFMVVVMECRSDNIDIANVTPEISKIENIINRKDYSDILIFHASKELTDNLKPQLRVKIDSLKIKGSSPVWKINAADNH
ncbi:MAG: glycosyltransferase family 39 protein [Bacteroidetes bacterium]|nr:glycosyltransferase family 39 protein [Bacteroidota bacterium]